MSTRAIIFDGIGSSDADYLAWLEGHSHGYVINRYSGGSAGYLVLHRATCAALRKRRSDEPGEFTERTYTKVCAESIESLREHAREAGRADGSFSKSCAKCNPDA